MIITSPINEQMVEAIDSNHNLCEIIRRVRESKWRLKGPIRKEKTISDHFVGLNIGNVWEDVGGRI